MFGFALTLLVVQLEVPKDTDGLRALVRGSVPFAVTFAMICYIWWEHNKFFRRYGLQDAWTAFLNCLLLFVVVFYVYPLKYLANVLMGPGRMPSDWDGGTVTATFYWTTVSTSTNAVRWQCQGRSYGDLETIEGAWGTPQVVDDSGSGTSGQVLKSAATAAITLAGTPAAGELVQFRMARLGSHANDTLADTARLLGVMIAYTRS